jgi:hypothetical protein
MSLLKYSQDNTITQGNGRGPVSFQRSHIDGLPFRGRPAMLREEEFEEFTEVVNDGFVEVFDLSIPEHKAKLQEIVDATSNTWYTIFKMQEYAVPQPDGGIKIYVYCVWTQPYRELAAHRLPLGITNQSQRIG